MEKSKHARGKDGRTKDAIINERMGAVERSGGTCSDPSLTQGRRL